MVTFILFNKKKYKIASNVCQQKVSCSFHTPLGSFHHSLTVLVHYRIIKRVCFLRVVPQNSNRIHIFRFTFIINIFLLYRALTFYRKFFQIFLKKKHLFFQFRSPLLSKSPLIYSHKVTEMFHFTFFFFLYFLNINLFHHLREFSLWKNIIYYFYFLYFFVYYTSIFYDLGIPLLP